MNKALSSISSQTLREELALRDEANKLRNEPDLPIPLPADQIDLAPVIEACNSYLAEMRAKGRRTATIGCEHKITMKVLESIYNPLELYPFMTKTLPL